MAIILTLRDHESHGTTPLVHKTSEDVVLGNVFGIVKNLSHDAVLNPWLTSVTRRTIPAAGDWHLSFWESQPIIPGVPEGSTKVDLEMDSQASLVFTEVKMDAGPSTGTTHLENRNQIVRNLDVGYFQAKAARKAFAVVYITPDATVPAEIAEICRNERTFLANPDVNPDEIWARFYWCSWASIGNAVHRALEEELLNETEVSFALDLLAYLRKKGLWDGTLSERLLNEVEEDKLYRSLLPTAAFTPHSQVRHLRDQSWRSVAWTETELREFLTGLPDRAKALLKVVAEAGGALTQTEILRVLPFLRNNTGTLRSLKSNISTGCRNLNRARIMVDGIASSREKIHRINPNLGPLCDVVIEVARVFVIPAGVMGYERI